MPIISPMSMTQRADAWWPVIAWTIVIVLLTSIQLPSRAGTWAPQLDKLVHFGLYFGFGWALARAARISGFRGSFSVLGLLAAGIAFAALGELLQSRIPTRVAQMADWLADVAGFVTAYLLYMVRWRRRWKTEEGQA